MEQLQYLQPGYTFREGFKYSNQGVMLAGAVAEAVTGQSRETPVSERILQPLGMTRTNMSIAKLEQVENRSVGYIVNGTESMAQPYLPLKAVAPAGSLNSTAEDMMKYMLFQLGDDTVNGTRLVSRENPEEMHRPQVNGTPYMWQLEEVTETTYGICRFTDKYRGRTMLSHGGNTLGFSALMTLLPCEDLGIIILTNGTGNFLPYALTYEILDEVLGVDNADGSPSPRTGKMGAAIGGVFAAMGAAAQAKAAAGYVTTISIGLPLENASTLPVLSRHSQQFRSTRSLAPPSASAAAADRGSGEFFPKQLLPCVHAAPGPDFRGFRPPKVYTPFMFLPCGRGVECGRIYCKIWERYPLQAPLKEELFL